MTRAVLRYVSHRITAHPDSDPAVSARCLHGDCPWEVHARSSAKAVDVECMQHTGLTGHGIFARTYEDVAVVVRNE
ncbi:hypothetical protein ABZO31_27635 [Streptomyces sp. HUAS MG47]|uniref:DUF7848 domain-containing protein n=1 Tax=Streptomyces solicamelliae TaxID=3231716 RepID=UPI003877AFF0